MRNSYWVVVHNTEAPNGRLSLVCRQNFNSVLRIVIGV